MEKPGVEEIDNEGEPFGVQPFIQKQRQIMGSYIEDQLGPSSLLDQVISGNPPQSRAEAPDPRE